MAYYVWTTYFLHFLENFDLDYLTLDLLQLPDIASLLSISMFSFLFSTILFVFLS